MSKQLKKRMIEYIVPDTCIMIEYIVWQIPASVSARHTTNPGPITDIFDHHVAGGALSLSSGALLVVGRRDSSSPSATTGDSDFCCEGISAAAIPSPQATVDDLFRDELRGIH